MQTEACRPVQSPGLASPPRKPTPNPQARSSATFFGRRLDLGIVKSASQRASGAAPGAGAPHSLPFSRAGHTSELPRGDAATRGETLGPKLRLFEPPCRCHRLQGSSSAAGSHAAGRTGLGHLEPHTGRGQVSGGAGGSRCAPARDLGVSLRACGAPFIISGSSLVGLCNSCSAARADAGCKAPSLLLSPSLPPSFPPAQIQSLLLNLPQGPTALSRSFLHLVPSPDPETWSRLSSWEWEMGRPVLASGSFESLRSAVNPRP